MPQPREFTAAPTLATGVVEQQDESVIAFDFDLDGLAADEEDAEARAAADPPPPAVITGVVNPGPPKQFMKLNATHSVRATYTVKVNSNGETIPSKRMVSTLDLPGVFKSGKSNRVQRPIVKKNSAVTFSDSITVNGVVPKEAGEFSLTGTVEYHGSLFEKTVTVVVK
jgi:hypothetical protein